MNQASGSSAAISKATRISAAVLGVACLALAALIVFMPTDGPYDQAASLATAMIVCLLGMEAVVSAARRHSPLIFRVWSM